MGLAAPYTRLAGVYDELVVDPCFAEWADFLEDTWRGDPVRRVLDICCGTGLMTAELLARGYALVGLDASPAMLELARDRVGPSVPLVEATLPDLPVESVFDAVVSTFDGLNYLSLPDLELSFAALADCLRPGGWLVFDVHGDATLDFLLGHPVIEGSDATRSFTLTSSVDLPSRVCQTTIDLVGARGTDSFTETHEQRVHSTDEVRRALTSVGFDVIGVHDEYSATPAGPQTLRATWIARRL